VRQHKREQHTSATEQQNSQTDCNLAYQELHELQATWVSYALHNGKLSHY
jgi:hypothetical protein